MQDCIVAWYFTGLRRARFDLRETSRSAGGALILYCQFKKLPDFPKFALSCFSLSSYIQLVILVSWEFLSRGLFRTHSQFLTFSFGIFPDRKGKAHPVAYKFAPICVLEDSIVLLTPIKTLHRTTKVKPNVPHSQYRVPCIRSAEILTARARVHIQHCIQYTVEVTWLDI